MGFIGTILFLNLASDALLWILAHRALRGRSAWWHVGVATFGLLVLAPFVAIIVGRAAGWDTDAWVPAPLISLTYIWHLIGVPLLLVMILAHLLWRIVAAARRYGKPRRIADAEAQEAALSRRQFLTSAVITAPALTGLGVTAFSTWQLEQFRVQRLQVDVPGLPAHLEGFTIAHLSDLHVGRFTHGRVLERIVETTNALQADLAVFTGDLINFALTDLPPGLDVLGAVKAKYGIYVCEGNHDLFESAAEFRRQVASRVPLLHNEEATVQVNGGEVQMLGLRWGSGKAGASRATSHGDAAVAAAVESLRTVRKPGAFPILLAHHPHAFDFADGIPLTLAGHTHGGQLMLTKQIGFGPLMFRYWSGLYQRDGRSLVVSNGVGNWFPIRTAAPAEIVHLTLRRPA